MCEFTSLCRSIGHDIGRIKYILARMDRMFIHPPLRQVIAELWSPWPASTSCSGPGRMNPSVLRHSILPAKCWSHNRSKSLNDHGLQPRECRANYLIDLINTSLSTKICSSPVGLLGPPSPSHPVNFTISLRTILGVWPLFGALTLI